MIRQLKMLFLSATGTDSLVIPQAGFLSAVQLAGSCSVTNAAAGAALFSITVNDNAGPNGSGGGTLRQLACLPLTFYDTTAPTSTTQSANAFIPLWVPVTTRDTVYLIGGYTGILPAKMFASAVLYMAY